MQTQEIQFLDRLLNCSDCHSEFIFTAGEQLFFHDKQFKNDPKRCKPCKSRRSGLAAVASGQTGPAAAGLSRTETRTECSECGIQTTVPFKPTQGRPVLCRQCFQLKMRAPKPAEMPVEIPAELPLPVAAEPSAYEINQAASQAMTISALTESSVNAEGAVLSSEAAALAAAAMAGASSQSSVASAADLATIADMEVHVPAAQIVPTTLIAAAEGVPSEMLAAELPEG